jgi:hypothetical protein
MVHVEKFPNLICNQDYSKFPMTRCPPDLVTEHVPTTFEDYIATLKWDVANSGRKSGARQAHTVRPHAHCRSLAIRRRGLPRSRARLIRLRDARLPSRCRCPVRLPDARLLSPAVQRGFLPLASVVSNSNTFVMPD